MLKMASISLRLVIVLAIVIQFVEGNQRIVQANEPFNNREELFGGCEDNISLSCMYGNCPCNSFDHALSNLASNVLINITTDVTLSSLIDHEVSDLQNVSIIGHNNPTVTCRNIGGLQFTLGHNFIIQGITWDGCGAKNNDTNAKPILKFRYSSDITIHNCSFQHSIGQAVVLEEVSGDININHCQFVYNSHYRGYGAAVHYSSNNVIHNSHSLLRISNCTFSYNKDAKSLVYIKNRISHQNKLNKIVFQCSKLCHNQGVTPIFVINQKVSLSGELLFQNNTAKYGAGIYITDHSTISFGENSNISFIQNSAEYMGGAVFLKNHSTLLFDKNSKIEFNYNKATNGTIYSEAYSNVAFVGTCQVTFSSNSATQYGAAIYSIDNSHVTYTGNSKVTFNNNGVYDISYNKFGGILYSEYYGNILFKGKPLQYLVKYVYCAFT